MGVFGDPVVVEKAVLERIRYAAQARIPQERLHRLTLNSEVSTWIDYPLAQMAVALDKEVHAQRLATERVPVEFTRPVEVRHQTIQTRQTPKTRTDLLLLLLPRWARWREPRWRYASAHFTRDARADVTIADEVVIERFWTYPDSTWAMPPDTWGQPVVYERVTPPS